MTRRIRAVQAPGLHIDVKGSGGRQIAVDRWMYYWALGLVILQAVEVTVRVLGWLAPVVVRLVTS